MAVPGRGITRSAAALSIQENKSRWRVGKSRRRQSGLWIAGGGRRAVGEKNGRRVGHVIIQYDTVTFGALSSSLRRCVAVLPRRCVAFFPPPGLTRHSGKGGEPGQLVQSGAPSCSQMSDDEHKRRDDQQEPAKALKGPKEPSSPEFNWSRNTRHRTFRATSAP